MLRRFKRSWMRRFRPKHGPASPRSTLKLTLVRAARTTPVEISDALRSLLPELDSLVRSKRRNVAVLPSDNSAALADLIRTCYPACNVRALPPDLEEAAWHAWLAAHGPYDVIVDPSTDRPDPAELYRSVFFHLRRGGQLATLNPRPARAEPHGLWPLLTQLIALRDGHTDLSPPDADEAALAQATGRVVVGENYVLVKNRTESCAKLRESEIASVISLTGDRIGKVLDELGEESFRPSSLIRDHRQETTIRDQEPIKVPRLALREYYDVVCLRGQVVLKDNLLLPETYRHYLYPRLINHVTTEIAPMFAQVRGESSQPTHLPGSYFHFDSEWPGHYGHVLTEQMSRLWAWDAAKAQYPELKVLLGKRPGAAGIQPFERAILESSGVPSDDIVLVDRPVRVERLLAATPMLSMPQYVSPRIKPIWNKVGQAVGSEASAETLPKRFFCGRNKKTRLCHNSDAVEQMFADFGFAILYPEDLPFASQVALFQQADVVAGYAGSALFTLCFCAHPKRVIMVSPDSYPANNEFLIAAVLGHEIDVFWSRGDEISSLTAHYTFDFEREGRHLRSVLGNLPRESGQFTPIGVSSL